MKNNLLTRQEFKEQVFNRDNHTCIFCQLPAVDAHHILDRKLFNDGGYYLNNGASVCAEHHMQCETTDITVEAVRTACNIGIPKLPEQLDNTQKYDKWGNILLPNGNRLRGELFYDDGVQKVLKDKQHLFVEWVKYPRTYHLPWSKGKQVDDVSCEKYLDQTRFHCQEVVITEKMDGENTTIYSDHVHARSVDSRDHPSRSWVKAFAASIGPQLPHGWRVCGENMFAKHSLEYKSLDSYFLGFSIWNENNTCLSWDETIEYFDLLGISSVPVLYKGPLDSEIFWQLEKELDFTKHEGYVVRLASSFSYLEFKDCVMKYVRDSHVQTDEHWTNSKIIANKLKEK